MVHNSPDTVYVQEVRQLEKQLRRAKSEEERKEVENKLTFKRVEGDLAKAKWVRQRNLTLGQMLYAMKLLLVVCSGVCGEQLLTLCSCKCCSVHVH